jgi:competence transcription factor ComK
MQNFQSLEDQLAFTKQLINQFETKYQHHLAAGRMQEMIQAKRQLARQRNIFGKLLKEKMGMAV